MTADEGSAAATDNEADADTAPPEEQRDLTSLSDEERRTEEVLFEHKARCKKFARGESDPWQNKGVGILRLLRNRDSGNVRVLMRQTPNGNILVNANLLKDKGMYSAPSEKQVKMVFAEREGELGTFVMGFGAAERAGELLGLVHGLI